MIPKGKVLRISFKLNNIMRCPKESLASNDIWRQGLKGKFCKPAELNCNNLPLIFAQVEISEIECGYI